MTDASEKAGQSDQVTLATELHFELFKQYAWFSSAAIGAIVLLVQMNWVEVDIGVYAPISLLAFSVLVSLFGNDHVVEILMRGDSIFDAQAGIKIARHLALFSLAFGVGFFAGFQLIV